MWPAHFVNPAFWRAPAVEVTPSIVADLATGFYVLTGRSVALSHRAELRIEYSLDGLVWIDLPTPRFGSDYKKILEENIENTTYGGVTWVHRLFKRKEWRLQFRVTENGLSVFEMLNEDVDGRANAFYFRFGATVLYCRKEEGFAPRMLEVPTKEPIYDYELVLTEEIAPIHIL